MIGKKNVREYNCFYIPIKQNNYISATSIIKIHEQCFLFFWVSYHSVLHFQYFIQIRLQKLLQIQY